MMKLPPTQNLVFFDDVLVAVKGYVRRSEMRAGLTRHLYVVDIRKSVIQFGPIGFVPALYGTATGRDFTVLRWDPFHIGSDG